MGFHIVIGDIFKQETDAIVLTTTPDLRLQGKLGGRAKEICGSKLESDLGQMKRIQFTECVMANAYNLACRYLIFAATPIWQGGNHDERYYLEDTYENCLSKVKTYGIKSISFPLLSAGTYKFPKKTALSIATTTLIKYANFNEEVDVYLVINDKDVWSNYESLVRKYLLGEASFAEIDDPDYERNDYKTMVEIFGTGQFPVLDQGTIPGTLRDKISGYIEAKNLKRVSCYVGVTSRNYFEKVLNGKAFPTSETVLALGINMGLNVDEINDLLSPYGVKLNGDTERSRIIIDEIESDLYGFKIEIINEKLRKKGLMPIKENNSDDFIEIK